MKETAQMWCFLHIIHIHNWQENLQTVANYSKWEKIIWAIISPKINVVGVINLWGNEITRSNWWRGRQDGATGTSRCLYQKRWRAEVALMHLQRQRNWMQKWTFSNYMSSGKFTIFKSHLQNLCTLLKLEFVSKKTEKSFTDDMQGTHRWQVKCCPRLASGRRMCLKQSAKVSVNVTLGIYVEAMCHTQSQPQRDGATGSGQQWDRNKTREKQTQTWPQASLHILCVCYTSLHCAGSPSYQWQQ